MTDQLARLVREIERVVTAPYVPSLQDLYDLIERSPSSTVDSWALQKPCQVGLLADVLVEGLSRSRAALPLLSAFASTTTFRDALLYRHPVILDTFLEKAVEAGESEYHPVCISLLSSPLPSGVAPPARLAGFITKLVSIMAGKPCAATIAPLHTLMNSIQESPRILDEVPSEVMSNLQQQFTKTLRNLDDHMGNLLCLATFARIASSRNHHTENQHGPEPPSWLLNIQHFFGPKRGLKTLDLVVLRAILACSSNCTTLTPSQAAESIRLAICVADAVDPGQKQAWISGNASKIAKLCEKVAKDGLDREIQMMGVTFLLSLRPVAELPSQIRDLGLRVLVSRDSRAVLGVMPPRLVSRLTDSLTSCDESVVYELLRFTVDALKDDNPNRGSLSNLHVADLLLSGFQSTESQPVVASLLNSVSTKETIASLFGRFPVKPNQVQCQGSEVCFCASSALKNKILLSLFEVYFAAALSQNGNTTDVLVMKTFVDRAAKSLNNGNCSFPTASQENSRGPFLLRDRQDLASAPSAARDWRSGVTEVFMRSAQATHDNMMKKIGDICVDLERRCYDVEAPLRSVEEERDRHISEAEQLKLQNGELQRQLEQSSHTVSSLQQSMAHLEENAESAYSRVEELSASLDSAHQELQEQHRLSKETLHVERETARTRELDLIATSTEKDDQLEDLQIELRRLRSEIEQMRHNLHNVSRENAHSSETSTSLQNELAETKALLEANKSICSQKEDEIKRLLTDSEDMRMELGTLKSMTEEQKSGIEKLYSSLQEAEDKLQSETEMLRHKHQVETSLAASEIFKHKEEKSRLHTAMQAAAHDASKELQSKDKRIQQMEKKIQLLRNERATKAREFSEAQQHISRLMGVMGFTAKPAEPQASTKHHRSKDEPAPTTSTRHSATYDDDDTRLAETFDSLASNLNAPSPKRPKGNRRSVNLSQVPPPNTPSLPAPKSHTPAPATPKPHSSRHPLAEQNSNGPTKSQSMDAWKSQPDVPSPEKPEENHLQDFDLDMDLEFSKDFISTSTAFSGCNHHLAP